MTDRLRPARLDRRRFLSGAALAGCSAAAWPLFTPVTLAAAPGEARLVVIVLRGAMDGLDVIRPMGDAAYGGHRAGLLERGSEGPALDGFFALHPALAPLLPLWQAGEFAAAHAVATPYRNKRSHFDGQDILEAGTGLDVPDPQVRDGWLNRLLQARPGTSAETAYAIGRDQLKLIAGAAPVMSWAPEAELALSDQAQRLFERIYEPDPLFHAAAAQAIEISSDLSNDDGMMAGMGRGVSASVPLARFAAGRLQGEARIATFSVSGWDTHRAQHGALGRRLADLADSILALREGLGPVWAQTTVLAITEFGRTVRENGTEGTDHGTGGALLMAGGALKGGRIFGDWPGLGEGALYEDRDLLPTRDLRAYPAWAMRALYGFDRALLEEVIFPGLDLGADPGFVL